ncbi:polyhydroxybutyrate depolymerase [Sulfitobacter sp. SK012]|uniref:alpha/beta hydrolase family esterase n=1 Tax=Sulfitobacter sp. SK012 TaxID=1389005 RepID=UPI000E0A8328|nr:prolyl oligopeptidase family serine peptidase [Sulfitobacter sp. SK012]AXI48123.1 polyhydroxybutyrate depolymerase [Sulfitobacter sp. SK012]
MSVTRWAAAFVFLGFASPALACGSDSECKIGDRHYQIALPEGYDGQTPIGAVIWSHGYGGSSAGVMRNGSLRKMVAAQGLALIAVEAKGGGWDIPNNPRDMASTGEAELAYFDAVIEDAAEQFPLDKSHLVASGFSAGGMMTWTLACARSEDYVGFVPLSGTYWLKTPETCDAPVTSIVHIHGDRDGTVPLNGREIRETKQGSVAEALSMYADFGSFGPTKPSQGPGLNCETRTSPGGEILEFCLFKGGHSFRTEYLQFGIGRLRDVNKL